MVRGFAISLPCVCGGIALAALYVQFLRRLPRHVKWIPGVPVLGVFFDVLRGLRDGTFLDTYDEWFKKHGKTFAFRLPGRTIVATIDPDNIKYFLKSNFNNYIKGHVFREPFTDILGNGVFNVDGHMWAVQRKTMSLMFTKKNFENHIWKAMQTQIAKVTKIIERTEGTFDMFNLLNRFTLDTIGEIGFSKDIGSLDDPSSPFMETFDRAQQLLILRFWFSPWWKVMKLFGLGWEPELRRNLDQLLEHASTIVAELRSKVESGDDNSFVGLFIKGRAVTLSALPIGQTSRSTPEILPTNFLQTDAFLRDTVLNFLLAGRDTTAQCLSWTLYELTQHPDVVQRIRDEVSRVTLGEPIAFEHLQYLRYVEAVVNEGLRLHPSVPFDAKLCVEDDQFPDGTVVTAGTVVQWVPYAQARCKEYWGEDAERFRPERWLERKNLPSPYEFSVFAAGPRECLGKRLAIMEIVTSLSSLVRDFDFSLQVDPASIRPDVQLTLGMGGLPLSARRHFPAAAA